PTWLDGTVTLAWFDVEEKNALISDASNIQTQSGKRTNRGVELQGDFNLTPNTLVKAAYTRNHSRQDVDGGLTVRTPLVPKHQASLWLSHRFYAAGDHPLTVAAGVRYNSSPEDERYYPGGESPSHTLIALMMRYHINRHWALRLNPRHTLFDLMMRYDINREWAVQLNARNLTDKTYVAGCDFYCYYGGGRTVDVQLQYQW